MSDIAALEKEIRQLLETFPLEIESLNNKDPSQRAKQILKCEKRIIALQAKIEAFGVEADQLDRASQVQQRSILRTFKTEFRDLKSLYEKKKAENAPTNTRFAPDESNDKKLDEMTGQELVQVGHKTQEKGMDALRRVLGQIEDANAKVDVMAVQLQIQDEQFDRVTAKVKDVQSEIKRAGYYIKYFARQVYTDKLMMCLIFLCIVAILVIIIMKIVNKEKLPTVQDLIKKS